MKIKLLCSCEKKNLLLVYDAVALDLVLKEETNKQFLLSLGYQEVNDVDLWVEQFAQRMKNNHEFPHEIGIALGYPLHDVQSFMADRQGKCQLIGCWKVYSQEETARALFAKYNECRNKLIEQVERGLRIKSIIQYN